MRRIVLPLLFGAVGVAILIALGVWQLQRLEWKEAMLAAMDRRIAAAPVDLPEDPRPAADLYSAVAVTGRYLPRELHVLTSTRRLGAGYRIISPFETEAGRRIMVDRGFVPQARKDAARPLADAPLTVTGNLHWPDETDAFTPEADPDQNIWYARDVAAMADALGTEPVLIVARDGAGPGITPLPLDTSGIPNDHLEYALTWFMLAAVWAGMTGLLLRRTRRREV